MEKYVLNIGLKEIQYWGRRKPEKTVTLKMFQHGIMGHYCFIYIKLHKIHIYVVLMNICQRWNFFDSVEIWKWILIIGSFLYNFNETYNLCVYKNLV